MEEDLGSPGAWGNDGGHGSLSSYYVSGALQPSLPTPMIHIELSYP